MVQTNEPAVKLTPLIGLVADLQRVIEQWGIASERRFQLNGSADAQAELDAIGDVGEIKETLANAFYLMFRVALEYHPGVVRELIRQAIKPDLDALADAVVRGGRR
jgi:hypothetical protein